MPGDDIPNQIPQHPQCKAEKPVNGQARGKPSTTATFTDCPGGTVIIERVVQVADNRLLWVQVRSPDRGTGLQVLDQVTIRGVS